jgi:MYXO-CTERM domain-containing protein
VKAHRGAAPGTALTLTNGDACMVVGLENGQRYLFYQRDATSLHINACSRVVAFPGAQEEIAALSGPSGSPGERPPPAPVASAAPTTGGAPSLPPRSGSCASCHVGPDESRPTSQRLWVLALAAALAVRRSRR